MEASAPSLLMERLESLSQDPSVFVAGGPVRDWLLGRAVLDVDLVVPAGAVALARRFAGEVGGHFVALDEGEGVARVVTPGLVLDFSQFRGGASTLADDLAQRDFTVNAMAVPLAVALPLIGRPSPHAAGTTIIDETGAAGMSRTVLASLIDPLGGLSDIRGRRIRAIGRANLAADPLRLLRAYRFEAQLGFAIDAWTSAQIAELAPRVTMAAAERITHELDLIMTSGAAGPAVEKMAEVGLLFALLPELRPMDGLEQPGFHHLDVLHHSLATLVTLEGLAAEPRRGFALSGPLAIWLTQEKARIGWLKWAALLHDLGKPPCLGEKAGRPTFYQHDQTGAEMVATIGRRLRWPRREREFVARLVRLHMRPFHLLPEVRRGGPSRRAMRRLLRETGADHPALFLLAMADSLCGCGDLKPADVEATLGLLWERVCRFYEEWMRPAGTSPRLLDGHDLQEVFGLGPGPLVGEALDALTEAQVEGEIHDRASALRWIEGWLMDRVG